MNTRTYRILVVDDEPSVCESVRMALSESGCVVVECANAVEALSAFQTTAFDLGIVDEMMPGYKGHELVDWFKSYEPSCPVIMISGYPIRSLSADETLSK